jgi:hypothetical protein
MGRLGLCTSCSTPTARLSRPSLVAVLPASPALAGSRAAFCGGLARARAQLPRVQLGGPQVRGDVGMGMGMGMGMGYVCAWVWLYTC